MKRVYKYVARAVPAPVFCLVLALPVGACVTVDADRILAKDLTAVRAEFASVDGAAEIGFAPRPGVTRYFSAAEVAALARKWGVAADGPSGGACFMRAALTAERPAPASPEVQRGEKVAVEVTSGGALLRFEADAESSGRKGDSVLIRNPETGSLFQARVESKGKVLVKR